jgi:hypothetical protein
MGQAFPATMLVVINRPPVDGGQAGFGQTNCVCSTKTRFNFKRKSTQPMNPKTPARFSIALESRARPVPGSQFSRAVYTRNNASQPGYYIIRLRLQHSQSSFRPRLRFL